jgi:hypothetical protein
MRTTHLFRRLIAATISAGAVLAPWAVHGLGGGAPVVQQPCANFRGAAPRKFRDHVQRRGTSVASTSVLTSKDTA